VISARAYPFILSLFLGAQVALTVGLAFTVLRAHLELVGGGTYHLAVIVVGNEADA
jgi:hypothetical protein